MLKILAREIAKQQRRLGGDFAVAYAVVSRDVIWIELVVLEKNHLMQCL